jgi:dihydroneopterin aldolase
MLTERQYRIRVKDFVLPCSIGAYPEERLRTQRVRFNIELNVRWPSGPVDDELGNVMNYRDVTGAIRRIVDAGHINLVETLAERIADACLADPRVIDVRVAVDKLDIEPASDGIGIEIERRRTAHPAVTELFSRLVSSATDSPRRSGGGDR